jgi:hypothetical protein
LNDLTDTSEMDKIVKSNANSILFIIPRSLSDSVTKLVEYLQTHLCINFILI